MIFQVGAWDCVWGTNEITKILGRIGKPGIILYTAEVVDNSENRHTWDRRVTRDRYTTLHYWWA